MKLKKIIKSLREKDWFIDKDFIDINKDFLQALIDESHELYLKEKSKVASEAIQNIIDAQKELREKLEEDLMLLGICATKTEGGKIKYVDPMSDEVNKMMNDSLLHIETSPRYTCGCNPYIEEKEIVIPKEINDLFEIEKHNILKPKSLKEMPKYSIDADKDNLTYSMTRNIKGKEEVVLSVARQTEEDFINDLDILWKLFKADYYKPQK
jgi:ATP-dependent helicase YprA (DUF1998 family)